MKAAIQYCHCLDDIRKHTALPSKNLPCEEGSLGTTRISWGCRRDVHRGRGPAKQIGAVGRVRTGSSGDPKPQKIHQSRWECSRGLSYDPRDSEAHPQVGPDPLRKDQVGPGEILEPNGYGSRIDPMGRTLFINPESYRKDPSIAMLSQAEECTLRFLQLKRR